MTPEQEIADLFNNKIKPFMLSISGKQYETQTRDGALMAQKILTIQKYFDNFADFFQKNLPKKQDKRERELADFTPEVIIEMANQLKNIAYFIDRKWEYFDDCGIELQSEDSGRYFNMSEIKAITVGDYSHIELVTL